MTRDTFFNKDRFNHSSNGPSLETNPELMNDIIANVIIAAMLDYMPLSLWNTTLNATTTTYRNIYSFSRPIDLILPYSLSLLFALPFLVLGYLSLRENGVAAFSDSFLQLLVTVTRSEELDRIAQPCNNGGDEMATKELKDAKIMFGPLRTGDGEKLGRMGFGLEAEIEDPRGQEAHD